MLTNPKPGSIVQVWYRADVRPAMPLHGRVGRIVQVGHGRPRNHGVEIGGTVYVVPAGNLRWSPTTTVYVDAARPCLTNDRWRWCEACHMFTFPGPGRGRLTALHTMASQLGLRRSWFQLNPGRLPHYDLTVSTRLRAISLGVVKANRYVTVAALRAWQRTTSRLSPQSPGRTRIDADGQEATVIPPATCDATGAAWPRQGTTGHPPPGEVDRTSRETTPTCFPPPKLSESTEVADA